MYVFIAQQARQVIRLTCKKRQRVNITNSPPNWPLKFGTVPTLQRPRLSLFISSYVYICVWYRFVGLLLILYNSDGFNFFLISNCLSFSTLYIYLPSHKTDCLSCRKTFEITPRNRCFVAEFWTVLECNPVDCQLRITNSNHLTI